VDVSLTNSNTTLHLTRIVRVSAGLCGLSGAARSCLFVGSTHGKESWPAGGVGRSMGPRSATFRCGRQPAATDVGRRSRMQLQWSTESVGSYHGVSGPQFFGQPLEACARAKLLCLLSNSAGFSELLVTRRPLWVGRSWSLGRGTWF
jgi:hypothetical protein